MAYNGRDVQIYESGQPVSGSNPLPVYQSAGVLVSESFDYISAAYPNATTETYTFKSGGSGGTTVATVTVVYTDSTKASLSTVTKT